MKVTLLGTGTPTNPHRFQSAVLVEIGENLLLFDAGRGAVHQMHQAGVALKRLDPVFITHHHVDHIHDLFDVMISSAFAGRDHPLRIFGPAGTQRIVRALLQEVYAQDIHFRLEEAKAIRQLGGQWSERPESIPLVQTHDVEPGIVHAQDGWRVSAEYVRHGAFPHAPDFHWRCLGYRIEAEGKVLTISGDTVLCEGLLRLAHKADLLIQCCHLPQRLVNDIASRYLTEEILPSSGQVGQIAARAQVKRMALTHLSASINNLTVPEILADIAGDFDGEVVVGEDLMVFEV
jgi:ribonuclease Z